MQSKSGLSQATINRFNAGFEQAFFFGYLLKIVRAIAGLRPDVVDIRLKGRGSGLVKLLAANLNLLHID